MTEFEKTLKAADQGNPKAQFNLACRYFMGFGTKINLQKSKFWYEKSKKGEISDKNKHQICRRLSIKYDSRKDVR